MICKECGFDNTEDSKFCTACGAKLPIEEAGQTEDTVAQEPVAEETVAEGAAVEETVAEEAVAVDAYTAEPETEQAAEEETVMEAASFEETEQAVTEAAADVNATAEESLSEMTGSDRKEDEPADDTGSSYYEDNYQDYGNTIYDDTQVGGKLGFAIASLVCGCLSILCCIGACTTLPLSIVAIVLGILTVIKNYDGRGFAIAGIVTGGLGLVLQIIITITYVASGVFD